MNVMKNFNEATNRLATSEQKTSNNVH